MKSSIIDFVHSTITGVDSIICNGDCHFEVRTKGCFFVDEIVELYRSKDFTPIEILYNRENMELVIFCVLN